MVLAARQTHREHTTFSEFAFNAYGAAVQLHQFAHQRQTDARTFLRSAARDFNLMKTLEEFWQLLRGNTDARIAYCQHNVFRCLTQRDFDTACERELESIGNEIENDLLPHVGIDVNRFVQTRTVDHELDAGSFARRAKVARELSGHRSQIGRFERSLHAASFDPREVEQSVDEFLQTQTVAIRDFEVLALCLRSTRAVEFGQRVRDWSKQQRERRAKLMAHV